MFLDRDLSMLKIIFLKCAENASIVARDRINFFLRELKTLDSFLGLQSFGLADETGLLEDLTQKMQDMWNTFYVNILKSPDLDAEYDSEPYGYCYYYGFPFLGADANDYFQRFILTSERDKFIDPDTTPFHLPTEIWKVKLQFRAKYSIPKVPITTASYKDGDDIPTANFVMKFIDAVDENLNVLPHIYGSSLLEVLKELQLLRFFVIFVSKKCIEPLSQHIFFTQVLIVAAQTAAVAWSYLNINGNEDQDLAPKEMNTLLSDLLEMMIDPGIRKIYIDVLQAWKLTLQPGCCNIKNKLAADRDSGFMATPEDSLAELSTLSNPGEMVGLNQMEILQDMLSLLRASLIHLPILDPEIHIQNVDTIIVDAGLLIYSLYDIKDKKKDPRLEYVNKVLRLDLPSNTQPIERMIYLITRKKFQSNLPRILGLGYVDFLLNNMKEFQSRHSDSLTSIINRLQIIQKELESLQPFLEDVSKGKHDKHDGLQRWATLLIGKAYEVEYVIDSCIRKELPPWCLELWLSDIIKEATLISSEVDIEKKGMSNLVPHDTIDTAIVQKSPQLAISLTMNNEIGGFEDVREELRDKLIKGCRELDVITIVGMPGLGKTTLASNLYSDQLVISHFDIRAQCCVSQVYKRKELLLEILHDATGEWPSSYVDEADVAEKLKRTLQTKRYLILVDDVWEAVAWDDLRSCFYDAKKGSRIILTTRHLEVAKYATSVSSPIQLRMFSDHESWKLLKNKVFGKDSCPPSLENVGQQIAKKCGGLPLSVVLMAGILAKMEMNQESWKEVATALSSQFLSDSKAIIERSYQDLPYHLKPCFLYLGAFLEDTLIDSSMVTNLWISESFIKSSEVKCLEVVAQSYLEDLIARNLVMSSKRNYLDGKVEAFRVHDLLLDFCKKRAAEENFLLWINWGQDANRPSFFCSLKQNAQLRFAFCEADNLVEWSSSYSLVRSVFFWQDALFRRYKTSEVLHSFKFVKVLHFGEHVIIDNFPTNLVHLKYFCARTYERSIPSSISNLWNLETLIIMERCYDPVFVPATIWKLVKLRNLHLSGIGFVVEKVEELPEDSSKLHELRTLSTPLFHCSSDLNLVFRKAPNLRELMCKFFGLERGMKPSVEDFPTHLEKLHISMKLSLQNPMFPVFISSSNIKELTLVSFGMSIQHLSNIAQLEKLQALHLRFIKFYDEKWEVSDDDFPQLKVLELDKCSSLKEWSVADDAFSNLERLVLVAFNTLKEIPSCFRDMPSLKSIELRQCKTSVGKSARDIRETQVEDYQNTDFQLSITVEEEEKKAEEVKEPIRSYTAPSLSTHCSMVEEEDDGDEEEVEEDDEEVDVEMKKEKKRKSYFRSCLDWVVCKN